MVDNAAPMPSAVTIDQRACRRLRQQPRDGRDQYHEPDPGLVPFLFREKVNGEIGTEPVADIREKDIGGVEGAIRR